MERPLSAASSSTAPSTTSAPAHRRNASIKSSVTTAPKAAAPSTTHLFLTNLRLLNLDLLPDWPDITALSFGNHDARARIKCTEYTLYQLFRLYDRSTTADKLQPFFPPLEPLQSVNLRAALYRCLNDLKKSGVLSKDVVFRKSMLDDCQGEKFWEVCLSFSTIVLRKVTLERKAKYGRPVAEKIGVAQSVSKRERESMIPMAMAHRAVLSKVLAEKSRKREVYGRLHHHLLEKEQELRERDIQATHNLQTMKALKSDKSKAVEDAIEKNWVGSMELKDALIDGDTCANGDGILVESFDQLWKQNGEHGLAVSNGADVGLLQSLNSRATQQNVRLRMWQNYLDRLVATKPTSRTSRASSESQKPALRFTRHRDINLKDPRHDEDEDEDEEREQKPQQQQQPPQRRHASAYRYDEILTAMREELRKNTGARSSSQPSHTMISPLKRAQTQPVPMGKHSLPLDTSSGAQDPHSRSASQTSVPMRPRMGRRVSSQSKTYEKPKVESQREPIPFKAELFSPLKENRRSVPSFSYSTPILSEAEEDTETKELHVNLDALVHTEKHDFGVKEDIDSGVDLRTGSNTRRASVDDASSTQSSQSIDEASKVIPEADGEFKVPALPPSKQSAMRPSLIERTRMSIAFNSSDDIAALLPDRPQAHIEEASLSAIEDNPDSTPSAPPFLDRRTSLLDRTRESISRAPAPPPQKPFSHHRSRSSLYPVNQFETPTKASRSSTISVHDAVPGGGRRVLTPVEQLLSPEAEYESVFKARPRIALSPVLSPFRGGDVGELEEGGESSLALDS